MSNEKIQTLFQLVRFGMVGLLNTLIDLGILNLLIFLTGVATGWQFSAFKGISFAVAITNSYFWNKFWTFRDRDKVGVGEISQFVAVGIGGFFVNVGVASFVVNAISPIGGASEMVWANVGAIFAVGFSLVWNFIGYKFIVFKK